MKNNAVIPYILIMAFGIVLIFFMSLEGATSNKEAHDEGGETVAFDAESFANANCISCHGGDLAGGGVGPSLHGLTDAEAVKDTIKNGKGMMPGGLIANDADIDAMVEYLMTLK